MKEKLWVLAEALIGKARPASRSYYTNTGRHMSLYGRISPLGQPGTSVVPELNDWVDNRKKVSVAQLQRIIRDLRKRRRYAQALEVSEWMKNRGACIFSVVEHAVQIDLIGKVRGSGSAEIYFGDLKASEKTEKTYGALLSCYIRQCQTEKSLSHLQKMKESGFASTALTYNGIMCLYLNNGEYEKVPGVLSEMRENNVSPDNFSYRICMRAYGKRSDMDAVEKLLEEMEQQSDIAADWNTYSVAASLYVKAGLSDKAFDALKKSEEKVDSKDGVGYNHLISLYAALGKKDEVLRLWDRLKTDCKRRLNKDYIVMLESLVKLGEFKEAERVLKACLSSQNCYDFRVPNSLVLGYAESGECEKAEALLEGLMEIANKTTSDSWAIVAEKYLEKGQTAKALKCMKTALCLKRARSLGAGERWEPNHLATNKLLGLLGEEGSVEDVEAFVRLLRKVVKVNKYMYYALLKAYVRAGKETNVVLEQMKSDNIDEDEETKNIIS